MLIRIVKRRSIITDINGLNSTQLAIDSNIIMQIFLFAVLTCALISCRRNLSIKDRDVIVTKRLYSPDSQYVAMTYYVDFGAMGESSSMTSILKTTDTLSILSNSRLPCFDLPFYSCYYPDKWIGNKTLQVFLNERPFVKEGIPFDSSSVIVNGITCKVVPYDYSHRSSPMIDYFEFSPDRKKMLIVYTYEGDMNVSVINYPGNLPGIGNILANTPISYNPIEYVRWNGEVIKMFLITNDIGTVESYEVKNYVNKNAAHKVIFTDSTKLNQYYYEYSYTPRPMYLDTMVDSRLNNYGAKTQALIKKSDWQLRGEKRKKSLFYYEYEYAVGEQKFRSYFRTFKEFKEGADFEKGDSIMIIYDPSQPLIHRTENNYSR